MSQKYTFMFYRTDRLGKVRTVTLSKKLIFLISLLILTSFAIMLFSIVKVSSLRSQKTDLEIAQAENNNLKQQLMSLTDQLELISAKMTEIDSLEYKIRDLVNLQKGNTPLKPIAVGGKEIDLIRQFSSAAAMNEQAFFEMFDETLDMLSYEVIQREINLSELAASLEDKKLVMTYTPTIMPVDGWISSTFGYRVSPFTNRQTLHEGIDIAARPGTDVVATASGTVIYADTQAGFGKMVVIDHGYGYITKYGHNSELLVRVGDKVAKGQLISKVGSSGLSTGPHLHYEVLVNGIPVNPLKFIIEDKI